MMICLSVLWRPASQLAGRRIKLSIVDFRIMGFFPLCLRIIPSYGAQDDCFLLTRAVGTIPSRFINQEVLVNAAADVVEIDSGRRNYNES